MAACPAATEYGLVHGLVQTVDCHIYTFVQASYTNLVGPGTMFANVFTALLTIYIALIGYQLLLGRGGLRLTQMPVIGLKIGLILAFLTSWAAYQTVVYDLLFDGPRTILYSLIKPMAGVSGFDGDVYGGLERAYADLSQAAGVYGDMANPAANILQGGPMLGSGLLWLSSGLMLLSTIGVILAAKIVLGFLLALGPVFIGLFLFDRTRGLFDGWLRVTIGFALAPLAACVFATGMLLMLAPFTAALLEKAELREFDMASIMTIALIVAVFTIVMSQVLRVGAGIASGFTSAITGRDTPMPVFVTPGGVASSVITNTAEDTEPGRRDGPRHFAISADAVSVDRRVGEAADAVRSVEVSEGERLGKAYRRMPTPTLRKSDSAS